MKNNNTETNTPNFGNGRYSKAMQAMYNRMLTLFMIEPAKAEKIARMAGSDAGAALSNVEAKLSFGKATGKDSTMSIAEVAKAKGVRVTNPLAIARAIQWFDDAMKNGIKWNQTLELTDEIQSWVDGLKVEVHAEQLVES